MENLGIAYILSFVTSLLSILMIFVPRFLGIRAMTAISLAFTLIRTTVSITCSFFIARFLHKRYGKKLIYIPVVIVPVVGYFANTAVATLLTKVGTGNGKLGFWINLTQNINNLITATVSAMAVIIVLYKNKGNEKIIPNAWILKIIVYVWGVLAYLFNITYYSLMVAGTKAKGTLLFPVVMNFEGLSMIVLLINLLVALIIPIYVLVMVKKTARQHLTKDLNDTFAE